MSLPGGRVREFASPESSEVMRIEKLLLAYDSTERTLHCPVSIKGQLQVKVYLGWIGNASTPLCWQFLSIILDLLILDLNVII